MDLSEKIIVALDVGSRAEALRLVSQLKGKVGLFKIGSQLFTAEGPQLVLDIVKMGQKVFLDLKFHDIPNTVVQSALAAHHLGVSMITLHSSGGLKMMSSVMDALRAPPARSHRPLVLAVTVLTSLGTEDLQQIGCGPVPKDQVMRLAELAQQAGVDGVVASPAEIESLRLQLGKDFKIVTPSIRPAGSDQHDQHRIATPAFALKAGSDYLVIGRPITASADPASSVESILDSIRKEFAQSVSPAPDR
jgi:orotidine-5'-phosphate decarboxylase